MSAAAGVASGVAPLLDLAAAAREAVPGGEAESRSGPVPLRALRRYCAAQALDARRLRRVTRHVSRVAATAAAHWGKGLAAPENVSCMGAGVPSPWREACFRALPAGRRWALLRWFLLLYGEAVLGARTGAAGAGSEDGEDSGEWGEEEAVATVLFHGWRTWRLHALASQQGRGPRDAAVASPSAAAIAAAGSGLSADRLREALAGMWAPQCSPEQASGAPSQAGEEEQADEALVEVSGEAGPAQLRGNRDYSRILDAVTRHDEAVAAVARALATPEPA